MSRHVLLESKNKILDSRHVMCSSNPTLNTGFMSRHVLLESKIKIQDSCHAMCS